MNHRGKTFCVLNVRLLPPVFWTNWKHQIITQLCLSFPCVSLSVFNFLWHKSSKIITHRSVYLKQLSIKVSKFDHQVRGSLFTVSQRYLSTACNYQVKLVSLNEKPKNQIRYPLETHSPSFACIGATITPPRVSKIALICALEASVAPLSGLLTDIPN